jgi:hypothetical protein
MTITITTLTCSYDTTILDTLALPLPPVLRLSLLPLQLPPEPIVAAVAAFATAAAARRGACPSRRPTRRDCAVWIRNERPLAHLCTIVQTLARHAERFANCPRPRRSTPSTHHSCRSSACRREAAPDSARRCCAAGRGARCQPLRPHQLQPSSGCRAEGDCPEPFSHEGVHIVAQALGA